MKLLIAIVNNEDASLVISELNKAGFMVTKLATSGGFLRAGNVGDALAVIEEFSSQRKQITPVNSTYIGDSMLTVPVEVSVGGATVFVVDVEQFYKI